MTWSWPAQAHTLSANVYVDNARWVKAPSVAAMRARSRQCFDYSYYMEGNARLFHLDNLSPADLWEHFVQYGQFELGAAHRCAVLVNFAVWRGAHSASPEDRGRDSRKVLSAALTGLCL